MYLEPCTQVQPTLVTPAGPVEEMAKPSLAAGLITNFGLQTRGLSASPRSSCFLHITLSWLGSYGTCIVPYEPYNTVHVSLSVQYHMNRTIPYMWVYPTIALPLHIAYASLPDHRMAATYRICEFTRPSHGRYNTVYASLPAHKQLREVTLCDGQVLCVQSCQ